MFNANKQRNFKKINKQKHKRNKQTNIHFYCCIVVIVNEHENNCSSVVMKIKETNLALLGTSGETRGHAIKA